MRILHITESLGGGVTSAINSYVLNSQQHEHFIFASKRPGDTTGEEDKGLLKDIKIAPRKLSSLIQLRTYINDISPDIIHIHSTYAGFFCRLLPFINSKKVVYTPHGFAFLRNDHPLALKLYRIAEYILAKRTRIIAGCGLDEKLIAESLIGKTRAIELINVCDALPVVDPIKHSTGKPVIGMVGRITAQKGLSYFKEVASACSHVAHFKWIGGGDDEATEELRGVGVEVTGWLSRQQVIAHMKGLDIYFHSAAWDGFPISVLEAAKLDLPIMLRRIGPFVAEGLETLQSLEHASSEILSYASGDPASLERARINTQKIQLHHSTANLQKSLIELYSKFA